MLPIGGFQLKSCSLVLPNLVRLPSGGERVWNLKGCHDEEAVAVVVDTVSSCGPHGFSILLSTMHFCTVQQSLIVGTQCHFLPSLCVHGLICCLFPGWLAAQLRVCAMKLLMGGKCLLHSMQRIDHIHCVLGH